jgi:hypothetical protein
MSRTNGNGNDNDERLGSKMVTHALKKRKDLLPNYHIRQNPNTGIGKESESKV